MDDEDNEDDGAGKWMFDAYQHAPANGMLFVPQYRFNCRDDAAQYVDLRMWTIPA